MERIYQLKSAIRREMMASRDALSEPDVASKSTAILEWLKTLPEFAEARTVHTYISWKNEADTRPLVELLLRQQKRVVVPRVVTGRVCLSHHFIAGLSDLRPGAFGILEPDPAICPEVEPADIDLVVVPALAVDLTGHRLGYGGGYYDSFLAGLRATKVVAVYHFQIVDEVPTRKEDQRIEFIVSETGVFSTAD